MKILIIDDDPDALEISRARLETQGYKVLAVDDGEKSLEIIRKKRPDVILLDVVMPKVDGLSICRIIKKDEKIKNIPVILLTAKEMIADVDRGFEAGANDYVTKPVDWNKLIDKIKKLTRKLQNK